MKKLETYYPAFQGQILDLSTGRIIAATSGDQVNHGKHTLLVFETNLSFPPELSRLSVRMLDSSLTRLGKIELRNRVIARVRPLASAYRGLLKSREQYHWTLLIWAHNHLGG